MLGKNHVLAYNEFFKIERYRTTFVSHMLDEKKH